MSGEEQKQSIIPDEVGKQPEVNPQMMLPDVNPAKDTRDMALQRQRKLSTEIEQSTSDKSK